MKLKKNKTISILFTFLILSACSPYKLIDKHTKKKLKKAGLEYATLETPNYTFTYWDTGETNKPVYVLLHGFGSSTHLHWYQQAKHLSKTHRLILPNLLYHGSQLKTEKKYGIQDQVAAMSALLEELKIDSMVLGGISYGGLVAAQLGMQEQQKLQKLTIFSSPVKFFTEVDLADAEAKAGVDDLYDVLVPATPQMMQELGNIALYKDRKIPKFILRDVQENLFQNEERNADFKALLDAMLKNKASLLNQHYEYNCPVLLVWGAGDELIPPRIGTQLNAYLPNSELHLIPKAGHGPNLEQKKKFNQILINFLSE